MQRCNHLWGGWQSVYCYACYVTVNPILCIAHLLPVHWIPRIIVIVIIIFCILLYFWPDF